MPEITVGFKTDIGRVRAQNQDSLAVMPAEEMNGQAQGIFIVADGVGGNRKGGDVASRLAVETITTTFCAALASEDALSCTALEELIHESLKAANKAVWQQARRVHEQRGMGTTCVLALLRDATLIVGNVGDSRCYLLRNGYLDQLTHDHAFLDIGRGSRRSPDEAGNRMQFRHVMTRGIGFSNIVEPEVEAFTLRQGDALLLCSDGLTKQLDHAEITALLATSEPPQTICDNLVAAVNGKGGDDNTTVILVHYGIATRSSQASAHQVPPTAEAENAAPKKTSITPGANFWRRRLRALVKRQR